MNEQEPKHRRRSRKSISGQLSDVLWKVTQELEKPDIKPARANLLIAQIETLKFLHQQESAQKERDAKPREPASVPVVTPEPSELDITVAKMLERHNSPPSSTQSAEIMAPVTATAKPSNPTATPRPTVPTPVDAETAKRMITTPDQTGSMTAEAKIRAARELVNPGRALRVVPPPIQTTEENMRSQPREIIGSPDAIPYRERITPVAVSTLDALARREEISGGGDFSPWVR